MLRHFPRVRHSLIHAATLAAALTAVRLLPYMLGLLAVGSAQAVWLAFPLVFLATAVVLALPSLALTLAAARYVRGRATRPAASADLATAASSAR